MAMKRSSSERLFERFLEEASAPPEVNSLHRDDDVVEIQKLAVDPGEYAVLLKEKLDKFCAVVALARGPGLKPQDSSTSAMSVPQSSAREQFDDEELEADVELMENTDPADAKRKRRMLSNRDSARRSRGRKEAHLSELEGEVSQLRAENSSLVKRLTDANQKFSEAAVDNSSIVKRLTDANQKYSDAAVDNSSLVKRLTDANQKYSEAAVDNSSLVKRLTDANQQYSDANFVLKADVETLRAEILVWVS